MSKRKQQSDAAAAAADTGLAAMVAAAQPGDHLVLADWVDEHLRLEDLAAVLRGSADDPRPKSDRERTAFHGFRYRQLDPLVMLYMSGYRVWEPYRAGNKPQERSGLVLGLCLSPAAPNGYRLWSRWLPDAPAAGTPAQRLWDELGKDRPAVSPEEEY